MADPKPPRDGYGQLADELRDIKRRLRDLEVPSGTQRAQAVADLFGRLSYAALTPGASVGFDSFDPPIVNTPHGPTLSFELDADRRVSMQFVLRGDVGGTAYAAGGSFACSISTGLYVDGAVTSAAVTAYGYVGSAATFLSGAAQGDSAKATVTARALVDLPAGVHTVRGLIVNASATVTGAGTSFGYYEDPAVFVDVMQKI